GARHNDARARHAGLPSTCRRRRCAGACVAARFKSSGQHDGRLAQRGAPHLLEVVVAADLRAEEMDDDVPGVDQHPIAVREALGGDAAAAALLQHLEEALSQRYHLALRASGGDDHVIGDAGFALEINDDQVFSLAVCEGLLGKVEKRLRLCRVNTRPGLDARYGGLPPLSWRLPPLPFAPRLAPRRAVGADIRGRARIEPYR